MSGVMPLTLNEVPLGGVIARCRQPQARPIAERDDGLHGAFAKRLGAQDDGSAVVLQSAGDDFGSAGAPPN